MSPEGEIFDVKPSGTSKGVHVAAGGAKDDLRAFLAKVYVKGCVSIDIEGSTHSLLE